MQSSVSIGFKVKTHKPAQDTNTHTHTHFAGSSCSALTHAWTVYINTHIKCIQTHTPTGTEAAKRRHDDEGMARASEQPGSDESGSNEKLLWKKRAQIPHSKQHRKQIYDNVQTSICSFRQLIPQMMFEFYSYASVCLIHIM